VAQAQQAQFQPQQGGQSAAGLAIDGEAQAARAGDRAKSPADAAAQPPGGAGLTEVDFCFVV